MFSSQKFAVTTAAGGGTDDNFENVTLLLNGDGTNGAQNNTFVDSSTNNFTITRNGNTTQGSFSPYGSNWSSYLDGSSYIYTSASSNAFNFGTGDFTVEFWLYPLVTTRVFTVAAAEYYTGFYIQRDIPNTLDFNFNDSALALSSSDFDATKNTWTHYAIVRSGGTASLFQNGTRVATTSNSSDISIANNVIIGASDTSGSYASKSCYISNFRVVKGTAVYSPSASTITVPTTPLTAVTNTSLLVLGSNRFNDASSNNAAITVGGSPKIQRFSPFNPTASYDTATIGGSGYFDGSGDYLATSATQVIPTGSFTIEAWVYTTNANSTTKYIVAQGSSGNSGRTGLGIESSAWWFQVGNDYVNSGTPVLGQWNYVAMTFNGSTIQGYVNGVSQGSISHSGNAQNTTLSVGTNWNSAVWNGYISSVRISNTVRTVTSIPTTPFSSDANTTFLANFTNAGIPDSAMMNDLETVGNAQVSTSVSKFGTGSLRFDGTGDYLTTKATAGQDFSFGTGDFTVEGWVRFNSFNINEPGVFHISNTVLPSNLSGIALSSSYATDWYVYYGGSYAVFAGAHTTNTWYHFAIVKYSGTTSLYINGTSLGSVSDSKTYSMTTCTLGGSYSTSYLMDGYIDDFRITKGYARYTANFTPPTAALPTK